MAFRTEASIYISWSLTATAFDDHSTPPPALSVAHTYQTYLLLPYDCKLTDTKSFSAFSYLCAVHQQRVNDPISSLPAAHSLHAAVVVSQCEMCLRAIIHKLSLQMQDRQRFSPLLQNWVFKSASP